VTAGPRTRPKPTPALRDYREADRLTTGLPGPSIVTFSVYGKPLSTNQAYRVVKLGPRSGLAKTAEARAYQGRVRTAAVVAMLGREPMTGDLQFEVVAYWPRRNADSDAATKLTKDALQGVVYANDRIVRRDISERAHDPECPRVEITVRQYPTNSPCIWDEV
jgi:Holliday junction resolvase RusA-like endonuclease